MARIFVSYSQKDGEFTAKLVTYLRRAFPDDTFWYDDEIHGGEIWWKAILYQISQADMFIYLLSDYSLMSNYCQAEMREALRLKKVILPFLIRPQTNIENAPYNLAKKIKMIQCVDISEGIADSMALARITGAINLHLRKIPERAPRVDDPKPTPRPRIKDGFNQPRSFQNKWLFTWKETNRWQGIGMSFAILALTAFIIYLFSINENSYFATSDILLTASPDITQVETIEQTATDIQVTQEIVTITSIVTEISTSAPVAAENIIPESSLVSIPTVTVTNFLLPASTTTHSGIQIALAEAEIGVTHNADWESYSKMENGVEMVLVPVGCFMMGSTEEKDEKPIHQQCFDEPFWIDKYEVSNAQFEMFGGVAVLASSWTEPNLPRVNITWFEAYEFCDNRGARLPTEVEWEYAARGPDSLAYPWGDEFDEVFVRSPVNSGSPMAEVGSHTLGVSWVGAFDLSGNVWEWVSSIYMEYPYGSEREKLEPDANINLVLRSGSWSDFDGEDVRSANRMSGNPTYGGSDRGFRCAY